MIPFVILGGFVLYAQSKYAAAPKPAPPGKPGLLVWGDGVFTNKFEINSWLRLHGADYPTWKRRHPAAVRLVNGKPVKSAHAKKRRR